MIRVNASQKYGVAQAVSPRRRERAIVHFVFDRSGPVRGARLTAETPLGFGFKTRLIVLCPRGR
jgi:hypothetical protein